ncbi:MAG: glycosyltransferase, partial [Dysgonamonadaceae bacterium]|nr:glycosyltransferase [Dysgonamonadaceae bacterium]
KGKWLIFADADDFFLPDFEKMLDKYADSDADMICFANTAADSETLAPALEYSWSMTSKMAKARHGSARYTPPLFQEIAGQTYPDGLDVIRYDTGVVWCRFIKRELVEQYKIRFQETVCRNDTLFAVKIGCTAKTILLDETAIYCYTQRQGNTVDNFDFKYQKARYFVSKSVMKFLREQKNAAGIRIFDDDLLFWYEQLKQNKYLYIKEFIPVLLLTVTKKQLRKNFWTIVS